MSQRSPPAFHQKPDVPKEKEQHSNPSHDHAAKAAGKNLQKKSRTLLRTNNARMSVKYIKLRSSWTDPKSNTLKKANQ